MSNPTPTAAEFKARYPKFAGVADALVDAVIAESVLHCGADWLADDFRAAALSLSAHVLLEEGALSSAPPSAAAGGVVRQKAGDVEIQFDVTAARIKGDDGATYGGSPYGRAFLAIRRRYAGAAVLVA